MSEQAVVSTFSSSQCLIINRSMTIFSPPKSISNRDIGLREACKAIGHELISSDRFIRRAVEWLSGKGDLRISAIPEDDGTVSFVAYVGKCFCADEDLQMTLVGLIHCVEAGE